VAHFVKKSTPTPRYNVIGQSKRANENLYQKQHL